MKNIFLFILLLSEIRASSQIDEKLFGKYSTKKYTGSQIANVVDAIDFIPSKRHDGTPMSQETFKIICLRLGNNAWRQLNIDAPYMCSTKHEDYFRLWNIMYKSRPVKMETWDEYCCPLIIIMLLDGTVSDKD